MKKAVCYLKSVKPVTFGKYHQTEKLPKELPDDYERRTWRQRLHTDPQTGNVMIPLSMIGNCLRESAKFLSIPVPGKGKATFTKHFDSGISVSNNIVLDLKPSDVQGLPVHVPSNGRPGGTTRVIRIFPIVQEWEGEVTFYIGDDIITADVFERVLRNAGSLIGIGTWRPRNRGDNGRFELVKMQWFDKVEL